MDYVSSTVFFDGRFWLCIVERSRDGKLYLGRYTFGPEPSNPRLLQFYLHELPFLEFIECGSTVHTVLKKLSFKKSQHKAAKDLGRGMMEKKSLAVQKAREERRLGARPGEGGQGTSPVVRNGKTQSGK